MRKRRARKVYNDIPYCTSYYRLETINEMKEHAKHKGYEVSRTTSMTHQGHTYYKLYVKQNCQIKGGN